MAATGFWPVKSRLKEVIDYANNPDKTTDKRYLDEDLYTTLRYIENDKKTDQTMYVSAINCPKQRAYQCMMTTKHRYGKFGGNIAYHGYQSFKADEVPPYEAHQIGVYLFNPLKIVYFTGFLSNFILNCYVFSLIFALMSENKGKFLFLSADYLIKQSCGSTLRFSCGMSINVHRGTYIGMS